MMNERVDYDEILEDIVSFTMHKRRGRQCISTVIPPKQGERPLSTVNLELAIPLALGHAWTRLLASGKFKSTNTLASFLGKDSSLVMRYMRLTTLAPDLQEAILDGRQPEGLIQSDLFKHLPEDWEGQRRQLGFVP